MMEETPVQSEPKKMNTGLMIGIAVAVSLCCCCLLVGGGAAYYFTTTVQSTYSSINDALLTPSVPDMPEMPEIPALPTDKSGQPAIPEMPSGFDEAIPQGGLGDDLLRADTWIYVLSGAAASGCTTTDPSQTTIEVLAEPDAAGVWQEKWTVDCDGSSTKSFEVTFVPSAQGGTDISVKEIK